MMKNFLKYLILISFIAPFSQESIAKIEDGVMGSENGLLENGHENHLNLDKNEIQPPSPQEFVDADGNLVDPPLEDNLLRALDEAKEDAAKDSPLANMEIVKDPNNLDSGEMPAPPAPDEASPPLLPEGEVPFSPVTERTPSTGVDWTTVPAPVEEEAPLLPEIEAEPSLPGVDDIPTPLPLPLPPEDEAPLPSTTPMDEASTVPGISELPLPPEDETPLPPTLPSSSDVDETMTPSVVLPPVENEAIPLPSLEIEDTPTVPATVEPPLLSPSEAAELAATIEDEISPSPSEVVQRALAANVSSETSAVDMGAVSMAADNGDESAADASMTPPADTLQRSEEQDADERVLLQAQDQEDQQIAVQNEFQTKALQQAQQRQLNQHLAKQEAIDLQEQKRAVQKKTYSKAGALASSKKLNLRQEQMNQKVNEEPAQSAELADDVQNSSIPQEEQTASSALTDEHGNLIPKDELKNEE